jgi:hypothetical protein
MRKLKFSALLPLALLAACDQPQPAPAPSPEPDARAALTRRIETAVARMLPDITVSQYARHYAMAEDGQIHGVYRRECGKDQAGCPEAKTVWTTPDMLPFVLDGGCGVVLVAYDPQTSTLINAACNGVA